MELPPIPPPEQHRSSDERYLARLEFNPELRKTWLNFFVSNFRVVVLLIVLLTAWGTYSYIKLPRESNPEVKIPIAVVTTVYPGASPADIEELVTKKIETGIAGLKGVKKISSSSANSFSAITVEFDAGENLDDSIRRLRDKVTTTQKDLPTDSKESQVNEISFDDRPIWTIALTGPYDGFTLRRYAENIQDELLKLPGVREVHVSGGDEREFEIAYDPARLLFYNLSSDQANQAVKATNVAFPVGNFDGQKFIFPVRTDSRFFDAEALGNIAVAHAEDGSVISLKDIAAVRERAIKKTVYSRLSIEGSKPQAAVTIDVVKRTGGSIIQTIADARQTVDATIKTFPPGVTYDALVDQAKRINHDFEQLTHDFILTLILVFGILFLIVGLKEALVAGLAIPLVFFSTFGVMLLTGISLNFLSVFSLILALGLLVDDAIVVVSATKQYLRTGKYTPEEAVLLVLNDFKVVLLTTTLTTVWAFLPLLFATGIIGQFIKSIPITVSVTLISSLLIALMINHPLAAVLERIRLSRHFFMVLELVFAGLAGLGTFWGGLLGYALAVISLLIFGLLVWWYERRGMSGRAKLIANEEQVEAEWADDELIKQKLRTQGNHEDSTLFDRLLHGIVHFNSLLPIYEKYLRALTLTKKRRIATLFVTALIFITAIMLPVTGIVRTEFFPPADSDTIYASIQAPIGLKLDETDKIVRTVEERLLTYPDIVNFSTLVGNGGAQNGALNDTSNLASITITLKDSKLRTIKSYDLATQIRNSLQNIPGAVISVDAPRGGPPSGAAFEARIKGDDLKVLDKIAHDLKPILSGISGVVNINISLKDATPEYTFALDPVKLEQNYLNAAYVGSVLRMAVSGTEITTVIRDNKEIKVMARFAEDKIPDLQTIQNLQIINLRKQPVYLKDVADIELRPSVNAITRIDQKRTVSLTSGVEGKVTPNDVVAEFAKRQLAEYPLPQGYAIIYGGENEQNAESVLSIIRAMLIAGILIISTLIIQFNSFKKALIVLVTIPLALIGVFVGLALFDVRLSFPGLIGILALFGIVVKNAIILMDKINLNLKFGIPFYDSVVDAGKSRLEAIFITSICTIFGIIPITLSSETWTALGSAVIFGLSLSSFLTLFLVPTLFLTFIGEKERF